ncbi:MFS transporter [Williamsia sp. SKLECPSW1]
MSPALPTDSSGWFRHLCVTAGMLQAVFVAVRVLITYRALELDGGTVVIGVITAAYSLVPLVIATQLGRWVDGGRLSAVLRCGAAVSAAAVATCALAGTLPVLAGGSVLLGVGNLLTMVAGQSYIPRRCRPADFDHRFGVFSLGVSLGQAGGLPLAGVLASTPLHTVGAIAVMGGLAAAAAVASRARSLTTTSDQVGSSDGGVPDRIGMVAMLSDPGVLGAVFSSLMVLSAIDLMGAYLPVLGQQMGWTVLAVTTVLTSRSVASVVSRAFLSPLLATVPRRALLVAGTAGSVLPVVALPWVPHVAVAAGLMAIAGFFWGVAQPLSMTWVTRLVPASARGSALSLRMTGNRLGQVVIPLTAGGLAAVTGVGAVFVATAALLAAASAVTWRTTRAR